MKSMNDIFVLSHKKGHVIHVRNIIAKFLFPNEVWLFLYTLCNPSVNCFQR